MWLRRLAAVSGWVFYLRRGRHKDGLPRDASATISAALTYAYFIIILIAG